MTLRKHRILSFLVALVMLFGMNINAYADIIEPLDTNIEGEVIEGEVQEEDIGLGEGEQEESKDEEEQEEAKDEEVKEEDNEEDNEEVVIDDEEQKEEDKEDQLIDEAKEKEVEQIIEEETNPDELDSPLEVPAPYIYYPESSKTITVESPMRMMSFEPMFSIMNDNGDHNNIEPPAPGSLDIDKWATPVDGSSNLWRIDLTLTGKNIPTTSDIVLVIDRSGSMSGSRITAAKDAATNFVNTLLGDPNNLSTRIAVVSFSGDVVVHNQSDPFKDYTGKADLLAAISGLNASGGTHTQAGLKQANALLSSSTANYKNIVLLSDGEPTYSYAINDFNSKRNSTYFENYSGNNWQNKDSLAVSDYNYSSNKGTGNSIRTYESSTGGSNYYYNHGNSAVAEAGYAKSAGVIVYSVGLSAGPSGQSVLDRAASPGKSYTASDSDLNAIFQTIAGSIAFAATGAVITDPMGGMFGIEQINETNYQDKIHVNRGTVSWDNVTETITWSLATISEGNPATMWYIVEISEDAVSGVVYPTNKHTYVTYTNAYDEDAQKSFAIPEVGINAGTIKVHYYRVNEDGDPINSLGDPITMIQAIMQTTTFMEGTDLELNTPYEVTGPSTVNIGGEDYYYNPTNNIGDNSPKTVTLTPSNTSEDVYFPYTKQTNVTVTFDDNYVGAPATYTRTTGKGTSLGVQMPSDPIRAKYIFNGWNTLADGEGTAFTSSTIINNDLTVYAQWSPNIGATLSISDYSGIYDSAAHSISINNLLIDDVVYYSLTSNGSDWTTTKPEFTNVTSGSVTVYVKVENPNYQDRTGSGTVTITPKPITIASGDASKTYDGTALTNNTHSITVGGLAPGETLDSVNISGTITNAGSVPNTISSAVIKDGSIDTTSNYTITYDPGTLTVNKVTIVLTADSASKSYDGTPLTADGHTITTGAFVGSEGLDIVTVVGSQTYVGSSANTITGHSLKPGTLADNYNISYLPGTLTIIKANISITVTANSDSKVYDGSPLTDNGSSLTSGTLASGDDLQVTVEGTITNVGSVTNEITLVKIINGTEDVTANYSITKVDGSLTITKKIATIVVDNKSKVFGTSDPIFTGTVSGLVNSGDLGTVTYIRNGTDEDVGFYNDVLRASYTPNSNYTVNVTYGDFTITPATAGALDVSGYFGVYDGDPHSVTINGLLSGDSIQYRTSESDPWTNTKPEFTDVSSNIVYVKVSNPNYTDRFGSNSVVITPRTIVLTANSDSKTYDGTPLTNSGHTISTGAFVTGEGLATVTVVGAQTYVGSSANTITGHILEVGTKAMNYNISYLPGTLTVTAADIDITVTANSKTEEYNGSQLTDSGWVLTNGSLIDGDVLQVTVVGSITNVGTEDNEITLVKVMNGTEDVTANYNITEVDGLLTVTKKAVMITAASESFTYDGTSKSNSNFTVTGLVGSDDLDAVVSGSIKYPSESPVVNKVMSHSFVVGLAGNYNVSYTDGALTMNTAAIAITVTADDNSKVYDGTPLTDSGWTLTSGTLISGDVLQVTVVGSITNVGTVDNVITFVKVMNGAVDVTANYNITEIDGELEITKRPATIVVDNASKVFGTTDPTFTGTVSNLINSADLGTVSYIRNGTDEDVGVYDDVLRASYTPNPNYTVDVTYGDFQIIPAEGAPLVVNGYTGVYDGNPHSISINNLLNDDTVYYSLTNNGSDWTTTKPDFTNVSSTLVYVLIENDNYEDRTGSATVTITPVTIVLTANSDSRVYDGTPLTNGGHSITTGSFVGSEGLESVSVSGSQTNVGSSANTIIGHVLKDNTLAMNYNISYLPGTLTITAAQIAVSVTANSDSRVYTGSEQTVTGYGAPVGLLSGHVLSGISASGSGTNVGSYPVTFTGTPVIMDGLVDVTENYDVTLIPGSLTITAAQIAVSVTANSDSRVYTGSEQTITGYEAPVGLLSGHVLSGISASGSGTNVGSYPVTFTGTPVIMDGLVDVTENYDVTLIPGSLTITPATGDEFNVTGYTGVYDGLEHGVSVIGQMTGDLIEYSLDGEIWSTTSPMFINVSTTTVYVRATNPNYTDRNDSALVTITPRPITITAASDDKIYDGDPLTNGNFSLSAGSLVAGHSLNATVTGSQTNVGSSPNIPSSAIIIDGEENVTSNYEVTYVNGLLRIDPATGPSLVIDSYSGIYDGAYHGIELDGIIEGDEVYFYLLGDDEDLEEIDWDEIEWTSINPTFVNVGSHTILVKVVNSNYNDRTGSGTVNITPRPISITAGSATKVFDNQPLTNNSYTLTSGTIVEGEELFDVTVTGTITQVGSVPNVPSNAEIGVIEGPDTTSNYAITYINGTLTITQPFIPPTLYQVNFVAGNGGSLEGTTTTNAIAGTVWSMITVPTPVADEGFEFIGWSPEFPTNIYQNWTFTASFQELEIEIIEEPIPEAPPVEEEEEVVEIIEEPIPEATPILPRTGQSDPMFLYGIGALLSGLLLRRKRR